MHTYEYVIIPYEEEWGENGKEYALEPITDTFTAASFMEAVGVATRICALLDYEEIRDHKIASIKQVM